MMNETSTLLLKKHPETVGKSYACYESVTVSEHSRNHEMIDNRQFSVATSQHSRAMHHRRAVLFMLVALASAAALTRVYFPTTKSAPSFPSLAMSETFVAPMLVNSSTTLMDLASQMVPAFYEQMVSQMVVFTPTVLPHEVYAARKVILKTRDLLDVFSPTYPNRAVGMTKHHRDLWERIRHYASHMYMTVGEFQDLHNSHVQYSQERMEGTRDVMLEWVLEFQQFRLEHPEIPEYLASPSLERFHHKESHLFWQDVSMPRGKDPATYSLQRLGSKQLRNALYYLHEALSYDFILEENAHSIYHNLRKELRSVSDEFELLQFIMFPPSLDCCPSENITAAMVVVREARKLLGDINDDWTAFSIYVEDDEYRLEQERLAQKIQDAWADFKLWVEDVDFDGTLRFLERVEEPRVVEAVSSSRETRSTKGSTWRRARGGKVLPLFEFLQNRKVHPTRHLVIGNEAGDADTIISAIALAYIESVQEGRDKTPVVAIPKTDLKTQRPETTRLLKMAGILHPSDILLCVDDPLVKDDAFHIDVTLVDHNELEEAFQHKDWRVVEIVDHHEDRGRYSKTCYGKERNIAFEGGKGPLVASACTLVAERLKEDFTSLYPASIGLILLGVILLDSVNLSERVGKVTQRDRDAVADLVQHTQWNELPSKSKLLLQMTESATSPDPSVVFEILQNAKYDADFWDSLSVRDALRLDYKAFSYDKDKHYLGVSTVLMPMNAFLSKSALIPGIRRFMNEEDVSFLGVMFAFIGTDGRLYRQLAICSTNAISLDDVAAFLLRPDQNEGKLGLEEVRERVLSREGIQMRLFNQRNVQSSRKQIAPILMRFFENEKRSK